MCRTRRVHYLSLLVIGLFLPLAGWAQQGTLDIAPRVTAGGPVSVELRNLSKLPVRLSEAKLGFPSASGGPCAFSLPGAVDLAPAEVKSIPLTDADSVRRCMNAPAADTRISVLSAGQFARMVAPGARNAGEPFAAGIGLDQVRGIMHPADLQYTMVVGQGQAPVKDHVTFHFLVE